MVNKEESVTEINSEQVSRRSFVGRTAAGLGALAFGAGEVFGQSSQREQSGREGRFFNRVVLITGATSGIGEGTAYAFARQGAKVFFCGRREDLGQQVEARIKNSGGDATYFKADVRREEDVRNFIAAGIRKYGRLDIAFNNAGIATNVNAPVAEQPSADFLDIMNTNAAGVFYSMKYEVPHMLNNEPWGAYGTRGVIINNASVSGHVGFGGISPYSASKHAIIGLTRCASIEYGGRGIRVNSISPGGVNTPMRNRAYLAQGFTEDKIPTVPNFQRRINTVDEMADVVMFLAENAASSIFGTDLDVTGGMLTGAHFTQART